MERTEVPAAPALKSLLSRKELAEYIGISVRGTYALTAMPWWPTPLQLAPRILRWRRVEVDAALASAVPRYVPEAEPEQLRIAREARKAND